MVGRSAEKADRLFRPHAIVHHGHQRPRHAGRMRVLDDVAAINDARCALLQQRIGPREDLRLRGPTLRKGWMARRG